MRKVLSLLLAIVPLAGLAVVITQRTTEHLERQATERLQHDAKTVMMEALGRLDLLSTALRLVGLTLAAARAVIDAVQATARELGVAMSCAVAATRERRKRRQLHRGVRHRTTMPWQSWDEP